MEQFAQICRQAERGNRRRAAQVFLDEASEEFAEIVLRAAEWRQEDIDDFEKNGRPVLIAGDWGRYWLAPQSWGQPMETPDPMLTPTGVVELARGLVDVLQN